MSESVTKRAPRLLLFAITFQFAILLTMGGLAARPLLFGEKRLLRVIPVDPRDIFRGEYVALGYTGIPRHVEDKSLWRQVVYLPLTKDADGKHWTPGPVSATRPEAGSYLRGKCLSYGQLEFGIESFYLQSGTGKKYEEAIRSKKLSAEVALTGDGQGTVRRLVIEP